MDATREYAVGWVTLALINAGLAQSKRRSGLGWFALSLVGGPVVTFVLIAFMRPPADDGATPLQFVEKEKDE